MNQELKQLILDLCKKYPVTEKGVALTITGRRFHIILDYNRMTRPRLEILANFQLVYNRYFDIDGNRAWDKDATEIYRCMLANLHEQERKQAATDQTSIKAIKELRDALLQEQQKTR